MMAEQRKRSTEDVRIGPVTVLTFIAILSMAVLAVLAISTSHASLVISQRQATAVSDSYLAEAAAQDFLAELDGTLANGQNASGSRTSAVQTALPSLAQHAQDEVDGLVEVEALMEGDVVKADFSCTGARTLSVEIRIGSDGKPHVTKWAMTAVQNTEQPGGNLWTP